MGILQEGKKTLHEKSTLNFLRPPPPKSAIIKKDSIRKRSFDKTKKPNCLIGLFYE